jgi:hypothetical protein
MLSVFLIEYYGTGTSTKKDIENFIKSQKLFDAEKEKQEEEEEAAANSPDGKAPHLEGHARFAPKPPQATSLPVHMSPRAGSMIGMSARAQRDARTVQWASVNVDSLAEDLVLMCQLEGKKHRLEAMKTLLQTNNLYHIALMQHIRDELREDVAIQKKEQQAQQQRKSMNQQQDEHALALPPAPGE